MQRFARQSMIRLSLRTLLAITFLFVLLVSFVIAPEMQRTSAFKRLKDCGMVIDAPLVTIFSGLQYVRNVSPEPKWHAFRQRINSLFGITTVPWYAEGRLDVPKQLDATITDLIRDLDDLKAIRNWDTNEIAE